MPRLRTFKKRGFTLIELLVVISIIGILAAFIVASFTSAQKKARDIRRKADMDALKKAFELAHIDMGTCYPGCAHFGGSCYITSEGDVGIPIVTDGYIKAIPQDPRGDIYTYTLAPLPYPSFCGQTNTCTGFLLRAILENGNDPSADTSLTHGTSAIECNIPGTISPYAGSYFVCNN